MRALFLKLALIAISIICMITGVAIAQGKSGGNPEAANLKNPIDMTAESIEAGEKLYLRRCRGCHGRDATGGPPKEAGAISPSNLIDNHYEHGSTDGEIYYVIRNGIPPELVMEPWDDRLDETDTWNVVNYLKSLSAAD